MSADRNIIQRLKEAALKVPRQAALVQAASGAGREKALPDDAISFAGLEERSAGYARFFLSRGLTPKDRALLLMPPGIGFYTLFLALARIGVPVMLVDPGVGLEHFRACTRQIRPTVFIAPPKGHLLRLRPGFSGPLQAFSPSFVPFASTLRELPPAAGQGGPAVSSNGRSEEAPFFENILDPLLEENHPALITFTSGSTGRPKAIMRTHGFLLRQGDVLAALMPAGPGDVEFCSFPVFTLANLAQGVTTLLPPSGVRRLADITMADVLACMRRHKATRLLASPDFCSRLCRAAEQDNGGLGALRAVHTGGGPVQLALLDRLAALAPEAEVCSLYGSTEAEPIALQDHAAIPDQWRERIQSGGGLPAGRPVESIRLRILEDNAGRALSVLTREAFDALCQPTGRAGEIVVSGPLVRKGYMNPEDDAETKIRVGDVVWHRTGDAGYCDEDGTLWLLGRCGAKIEAGGGHVYPFAVEAAASLLPEVRRAALIRARGKIILAVEGDGVSEAQRAGLMKIHSALDEVVSLPYIPVDARHNSKVLYAELRGQLERTP